MKSKQIFKDILSTFILGVLAGMSISIGCVAFLAPNNKIVGSLFFVVGLFMVCNFKFNLFTGKVCYALENPSNYLIKLLIIWIGNFVGACVMAFLVNATRLVDLSATATSIVNVKLNDNIGSLFVLGIFCNMMIYLAVHGYSKFENPLAKMMALILGVSVFVLCGFEHCVADMFYFAFAQAWSWNMFGRLLIITFGNSVGGILIPGLIMLAEKLNSKNK